MFALIAGDDARQPDAIAAMAARLGPAGDAPRIWLDERGTCSVARRRLDLLPEDAFDLQPLIDDGLIFVCRARLDSRSDVLAALSIDAAAGAALSDANILRHAYKRWREDTAQHVYGDFAFVAWERDAQRLVAATDHIGSVPLFYCREGARLLISSQLAPLLAHPAISPRLDVKALGLMAANKLGQGWTMFEGMHPLPGGEVLTFQHGRVSTRRWWQPDTTARIFHKRSHEYVDEVRPLFESAVLSRMRTTGNIATTLSGGLDSTLVTSIAARELAARGQSIDAFTSVPQPGMAADVLPMWDADDAPWATAVAKRYPNIRHHLISPDGMIPFDILDVIHSSCRTPVRNTANFVWAWKMSQWAAANGAPVMLHGSFGNLSISAPGDAGDLPAWSMQRLHFLAQRITNRLTDRDFRLRTTPPKTQQKERDGAKLLRAEFRALYRDELLTRTPDLSYREMMARTILMPLKAAHIDFTSLLGVEWRDPTSDRRLVEHLLALPLSAFLAGGRMRGLARELGVGLLPESVRLRRTRGLQTPEQAAWFAPRAAAYRAVFRTVRASEICAAFIDFAQLEAALDRLCTGSGSGDDGLFVHRTLDVGLFAATWEHAHASPLQARPDAMAACA